MGETDDKWHARQRPFDAALQRHHRHWRLLVLPKQHMMFEVNRVTLSQIDFRHRHDLAFNLAGARAEMNLGHVLDARGLAPSRLADQIANVERRAASPARERRLLVLRLAPFTVEARDGIGSGRGRRDSWRFGFYRSVVSDWRRRARGWRGRRGRGHSRCLAFEHQHGPVNSAEGIVFAEATVADWTISHHCLRFRIVI